MSGASLRGARVLVVEDEFLLADEMRSDLEDIDAEVLGPFGHLAPAMELVREGAEIDAAVLDLNIGGREVFPLADLLAERGVPMVFATGYSAQSLPARFAGVPTCEKPVAQDRLVSLLQRSLGASAP